MGNTKLVGIKIEDPLPCTNDAGPKCSLMSIGAFVHFFCSLDPWIATTNHLVSSCCAVVSSEAYIE